MADVLVLNKIDAVDDAAVESELANLRTLNPDAALITARSALRLDGGEIAGRRVVVVEDGPTLTHGGMAFGAGIVAARQFGASEIVDPRPFAVGSIRTVLEAYPHLDPLIPAMGYGKMQMHELAVTLNATDADIVLAGTPIDLRRVLTLNKPVVRVRYDLEPASGPPLADLIAPVLRSTTSDSPALV